VGRADSDAAVTASDTAGFAARPVKKGVVSVDISTGPASAVPIEAPRSGPGRTPPTSMRCSSGAADAVTAKSCDARRAHAESGEQHRPRDDLRHRTGVERDDHHHAAGEQRRRRRRTRRV
jgi:hypothetical protein